MSSFGVLFASGFQEPQQNYFRLPNTWLELLAAIRKAYKNRSLAPIKVLEYIIKHTWGWQKFDTGVRLSLDEIMHGRWQGRGRADQGTGLSVNAVRGALDMLIKLGYIEKSGFNYYKPKLKQDNQTDGVFQRPVAGYFKMPKDWTDVTCGLSSSITLLLVEYFIRHAWGYQNSDGVWLDMDDLLNGRRYQDGRRYDAGLGCDPKSLRGALEEALRLGLIVWTGRCEKGRLFNLHLAGMPTGEGGEYLGTLPWESPVKTAVKTETIPDAGQDLLDRPLADALRETYTVDTLLRELGIYNPVRGELAAQLKDPAQVCAWALYSHSLTSLTQNPAGFLVRQLQSGEKAPKPFADLVKMPLSAWIEMAEQWQTGIFVQTENLQAEDIRLWLAVFKHPKNWEKLLPACLQKYFSHLCEIYFEPSPDPVGEGTETAPNHVSEAEVPVDLAEPQPVSPVCAWSDYSCLLSAAAEAESLRRGEDDSNQGKAAENAGEDDRLLKDTSQNTIQPTEKTTTENSLRAKPLVAVFQKADKKDFHGWLLLAQNRSELLFRPGKVNSWQSGITGWLEKLSKAPAAGNR